MRLKRACSANVVVVPSRFFLWLANCQQMTEVTRVRVAVGRAEESRKDRLATMIELEISRILCCEKSRSEPRGVQPVAATSSISGCSSKLKSVGELKRDPISQAIECGDCHLSNGWPRAFYRRTVKCANRRSVPPLHFNQIISLLAGSATALKDLARPKGLISFGFLFSLLLARRKYSDNW